MSKEKATLELAEKLLSTMKKAEVSQFQETMKQIQKFRKKEITVKQLDEWLLFTPRKVKEASYQIDEILYAPRRTIRDLIEPGFFDKVTYTKKMENEDLESVYQGVLKQARERKPKK